MKRACPCGTIRSLLWGATATVTAAASTEGTLLLLPHCRASRGQGSFTNPAVLLVAEVSSSVRERRRILTAARTAKTQRTISACDPKGPGSPHSYRGVTSRTAQILCRCTEVWALRQSCSGQSHINPQSHISPELCYPGCGFTHPCRRGVEFCRVFVCFLKEQVALRGCRADAASAEQCPSPGKARPWGQMSASNGTQSRTWPGCWGGDTRGGAAWDQTPHVPLNHVAGLVASALGHTSVDAGCPCPSLHLEVTQHLGCHGQI